MSDFWEQSYGTIKGILRRVTSSMREDIGEVQ